RPQEIGRIGSDTSIAAAEADVYAHLARFDRIVRDERGDAVRELDPFGAQSSDEGGRSDRARLAERGKLAEVRLDRGQPLILYCRGPRERGEQRAVTALDGSRRRKDKPRRGPGEDGAADLEHHLGR